MSATAAPAHPASVSIRPIRPEDAPALERFYERLSDESRTRRFLAPSHGLSHTGSRTFCAADHAHREGFVAELATSDPSTSEIVGHVCLEPDGDGSAEVAVAVADRLQGMGIGRRLVLAGVDWAAQAGIKRLSATAFSSNVRIIRLLKDLGLPVRLSWSGGGTCDLSIDLTDALPAAA
jgi:RimJ/RimL family protein N-acetyltransferase